MRSVGEYCSRNVVTAERDQSLLEIARRMREQHVGCVVVVEPDGGTQSRLIGIVTDRDLVVRVLAHADRHLEQVQAGDIMAQPVVCARESDDLEDALRLMRSAGVRRLPVVDQNNGVVGLLSFDDLICQLQGSFGELASLLHREWQEEQRALP